MATNKTIAPTGVTVQIPGLTDAPDMSVPANAIDKAIDGINALNSQLAQSYYDMKDSSTNAIGLIRFAGNKIAILSFQNQSGQISSSGLQLPYTFKDDISTICQYYNGSENDYGQLMLSKTGLVQIRKSGQYVNATYVLGQITACLS